jgi:demethylmenaquinone methyltransferase / 2-methoxy-6-polyprenyl-1,4-benzoquinol methylase
MINPEKNWFGNRNVGADEKTGLVIDVFDSVAPRYDLMNDLMSGGLHRLWKDRFVRMIRPRPGLSYLDVAGGTGDIAFRIRKEAGADAAITVCDLNDHMLETGRDRAIDKGWPHDFEWVTGNAESLPFPDSSFNVYTIAFGLRNVTRIDTALKDAWRVLKPGGRFYCLEFSHVESVLLGKAYDFYSHTLIPKMGQLVAKDTESYRYLVESIRKFPSQRKLAGRLEEAGFARVKYTNFSAGIVCVHEAIKL